MIYTELDGHLMTEEKILMSPKGEFGNAVQGLGGKQRYLSCHCCAVDTQSQLAEGWKMLKQGAETIKCTGGFMANHITEIIQDEPCYVKSLAATLSAQLANRGADYRGLRRCFLSCFKKHPELAIASMRDLFRYVERDPACNEMAEAMLFFKGFHAIQVYRLANRYWLDGNVAEAYWLQNRASVLFGVDIHPAAQLGSGLFVDHATGIVIGETAVLGDNVSLLHGVTLGGTGQEVGDRHPKVGNGVVIGANASLLGNIRIGDNSIVGASTVVLKDVEANSRVVGNPARCLASK